MEKDGKTKNMKQKKIIHIGLPKTGTTSLQKYLFPEICKKYNFLYNPSEFLKIKRQRLTYDKSDLMALKKIFAENNVMISHEGLVDWNPRNWLEASNRAVELFGEDATIVITIREPVDYMRSLYIQKIHEGNIIKPDDFFITSTEYDRLKLFLPERSMLRFDHQMLDYNYLKSIYEKKFKSVYLLPLSRINSLYPFNKLFTMSQKQITDYEKTLKNAPIKNKAYSNLAFKLTFKREAILKCLNLKSFGSEDFPLNNSLINKTISEMEVSSGSLSTNKKISKKLSRLLKKFVKPWRWWMQMVVDRTFPYRKFNLPSAVLDKFDKDLLSVNEKLIKNIEDEIDALKNDITL